MREHDAAQLADPVEKYAVFSMGPRAHPPPEAHSEQE